MKYPTKHPKVKPLTEVEPWLIRYHVKMRCWWCKVFCLFMDIDPASGATEWVCSEECREELPHRKDLLDKTKKVKVSEDAKKFLAYIKNTQKRIGE